MSGGVAAWCARQMPNLVPEALRVRAATWSSALIVSWFPPVQFALARHHNQREREFWRSTLDTAGLGAARATLGRRRRTNIALRLPADLVIEHPVTLPSAAERHFHGVVGYEMDRLTPLAADKVFWAAATESRDRSAGRLALRLAIGLKAGLRSLLLARWEIVPPRVTNTPHLVSRRIPLGQTASRSERRWRSALTSAASACAGLTLVPLVLLFARTRFSVRLGGVRPSFTIFAFRAETAAPGSAR